MAKVLAPAGAAFVNNMPLIDCTINIEIEQIDVTTMTEPDPTWTFIDAAGHFHAYTKDFMLPTLKAVEVYVAVEPGDDEDDDYEEEQGYSYYEQRCRICDEVIAPGTQSTVGPKYAAGRKSWTVDVTGRREDLVPLATELVSVWMADAPKVFGVGQLLVNVTPVDDDGNLVRATIQGMGELGSR
jgi:hypothetical protein